MGMQTVDPTPLLTKVVCMSLNRTGAAFLFHIPRGVMRHIFSDGESFPSPITFFITLITSPQYTPPLACVFHLPRRFSAGQITGREKLVICPAVI